MLKFLDTNNEENGTNTGKSPFKNILRSFPNPKILGALSTLKISVQFPIVQYAYIMQCCGSESESESESERIRAFFAESKSESEIFVPDSDSDSDPVPDPVN